MAILFFFIENVKIRSAKPNDIPIILGLLYMNLADQSQKKI